MLESVCLQNFQNHRLLRVEFDPHVTVLTGASDSGKSAVLRALRWLFFNKPSGDSFRRHGAKKPTIVTVKIDGHVVKRIRSDRKNEYVLDGKRLVSFGKSGVPQAIVDLINVGETNFQRQHDGPFWLDDTPGQAAKHLNKIVNLGSIDTSLSYVKSELGKAKSEVEFTADRLKQAKADRGRLGWVTAFSAELTGIEGVESRHSAIRSRIDSLTLSLSEAGRTWERAENAANATLGAEKALSAGRRARDSRDRADTLERIIKDAKKASRPIRKPDLSEVLATREEGDRHAERTSELEGLIQELKKAEEEVCQLTERHEKAQSDLRRNTKGKCPTCGRPIRSASP